MQGSWVVVDGDLLVLLFFSLLFSWKVMGIVVAGLEGLRRFFVGSMGLGECWRFVNEF